MDAPISKFDPILISDINVAVLDENQYLSILYIFVNFFDTFVEKPDQK